MDRGSDITPIKEHAMATITMTTTEAIEAQDYQTTAES
jgi:hypothetical protein